MKLAPLVIVLLVTSSPSARADTFGSGANTFNIEFVDIGNPGNVADTTGDPNPAGSVPYFYRIGKYEISRDMVTKTNSAGELGITLEDMELFGGNSRVHLPATGVSWNEAARFVNWLNTSQGFTPAYKFMTQPGDAGYAVNANILLWDPSDAGYNPNNNYRNSQAKYFMPSVDEWYKAAYFDPTNGVYYDYPTGSDEVPRLVRSGTAAGSAVYDLHIFGNGPADIMQAGGLSPYGTMAQGGNASEWEETDYDLVNDSSSSFRGSRGGWWGLTHGLMLSRLRNQRNPTRGDVTEGFRVASIAKIPEPTSLLLGALASVGVLLRRRCE